MSRTAIATTVHRLRAPLRAAGAAAILFGLVCFAITWLLAADGEPAAEVFASRRVPLLWCVVVVGAGVVLLLVSAVLSADPGAKSSD
jgi:hypothetical protein